MIWISNVLCMSGLSAVPRQPAEHNFRQLVCKRLYQDMHSSQGKTRKPAHAFCRPHLSLPMGRSSPNGLCGICPPPLSSRAFLRVAVLLKVSLVVCSRRTSSPSSPTSPPWTSATFCVGTLQTAPLQLTLAPRAFHSRAPAFSSLLVTSCTSVLAAPP